MKKVNIDELPENIKNELNSTGYAIDIQPITEDMKKDRIPPQITLYWTKPNDTITIMF